MGRLTHSGQQIKVERERKQDQEQKLARSLRKDCSLEKNSAKNVETYPKQINKNHPFPYACQQPSFLQQNDGKTWILSLIWRLPCEIMWSNKLLIWNLASLPHSEIPSLPSILFLLGFFIGSSTNKDYEHMPWSSATRLTEMSSNGILGLSYFSSNSSILSKVAKIQ